MPKIKAIIKRPDEKVGHMTWISDTLKNLQIHVGGPIEVVPLTHNSVIICNEEGKIDGLPPNFMFGDVDMICGTVIVCGVDGDEFCDVPFDLDFWKKWLEVD